MTSLQRFDNADGIEIVIDLLTGESFASQSGAARMCEVSETAIRKFLTSNQIKVKSAEILTRTGSKTSNLVDEDGILRCLAKYSPSMLVKFAKLGLRAYLHQLAGYQVISTAIAKQSQKPQYYIGMVTEEPKQWTEHFDAEFRFHARRLTGYEWDWKCMSQFINAVVYDYLPQEVRQELNRVNPLNGKNRLRKQHQHLAAETTLKTHINQLKVCMRVSKSLPIFWDNLRANFDGVLQLDIPGIE